VTKLQIFQLCRHNWGSRAAGWAPGSSKETLAVAASTAIGSFQRHEHDPDEVAEQKQLMGRLLGSVPKPKLAAAEFPI
jgi:hypothetical protein